MAKFVYIICGCTFDERNMLTNRDPLVCAGTDIKKALNLVDKYEKGKIKVDSMYETFVVKKIEVIE